jgi:hypothetical protein
MFWTHRNAIFFYVSPVGHVIAIGNVTRKNKVLGVLLETSKGNRSGSWRSGYTTGIGDVELVDGYDQFKLMTQTRKTSDTQESFIVLRSFVDTASRW